MNFKKIIFPFLLGTFIGMIIFGFGIILKWENDRKKTDLLTHELKKSISTREDKDFISHESFVNPPEDSNDIYWDYVKSDYLQVDFDILLERNEDTVAWLQVNGTSIDYPVVQSSDNEYYLTHSFDRSFNQTGWIYSDYRNNFEQIQQNTIIYGQARSDGSMFGSLKNIVEKTMEQERMNYIIKLSTPKENMIWQIFSAYTISNESDYLTSSFANNDNYQEFLDTITKRSNILFSTDVDVEDRLLTLATCFNHSDDQLVIHAKLIKKETISS